ncbi:hypothetical protein [Paenibacillus agaridevorans]|uniref:hypothetical protein n=1 Tax=Paenibacillus agaridevorans TaxID=171404 RepID=UPI001BE4072E|nr:hypothetical protein [Paenibacillus agaridevorans]
MNVYPIQWKRVTTGIVLTSMLTVLAACGGNNGAENGNKSESGAAPSPTAAQTRRQLQRKSRLLKMQASLSCT